MFYGGESNVPGAPGNLLAGAPSFDIRRVPGALGGRSGEQLRRLYEGGTQQNEQLNDELMRRGIMPGSGPQLPMAFGSSNLPGAVGNMGGIANAQFFEGPQLGQASPQGEPQKPYGGAPNIPLTPEQKAKLMQQGSPPPAEFNIQDYLRKAQAPGSFQAGSLVANVPGRYPSGMEGAVDLTYPAGSPNYGKPVPNPMQPGQPLDANAAEMEMIRRLRSAPQGFQNKMVY
jgi:hypothetical protein